MSDSYTFKEVGRAVVFHLAIATALAVWTPLAVAAYAVLNLILFLLLKEPLFK